jgi:hypothetical protein
MKKVVEQVIYSAAQNMVTSAVQEGTSWRK